MNKKIILKIGKKIKCKFNKKVKWMNVDIVWDGIWEIASFNNRNRVIICDNNNGACLDLPRSELKKYII